MIFIHVYIILVDAHVPYAHTPRHTHTPSGIHTTSTLVVLSTEIDYSFNQENSNAPWTARTTGAEVCYKVCALPWLQQVTAAAAASVGPR